MRTLHRKFEEKWLKINLDLDLVFKAKVTIV